MAVYFARAGEAGPVKIGVAANVETRLKALQLGHYETLAIIRVIDGHTPEEEWLHQYFSDAHIRGEWFRFCDDMLTVTPPAILATKRVLSDGAYQEVLRQAARGSAPTYIARRLKLQHAVVMQIIAEASAAERLVPRYGTP